MSFFHVGQPNRSPSSNEFEQVDLYKTGIQPAYGNGTESPPPYDDPDEGHVQLGVSFGQWQPDTGVLDPRTIPVHQQDAECRDTLARLDIDVSHVTGCSTMTRGYIWKQIYTSPIVLVGILSLLAGVALFIAGLTTSENIMWGMSIALLVIGIFCLWIRRARLTPLFYDVLQFETPNGQFRVLYYEIVTRRGAVSSHRYKLHGIHQFQDGVWVAGITPEDVNNIIDRRVIPQQPNSL
jgi:hypothetical protein